MHDLKSINARRQAYQKVFAGPDAALVLEDLMDFCRAESSTFVLDDPNGRESAFREGRREVYLRIKGQMNFTDDQMRHFVENNGVIEDE